MEGVENRALRDTGKDEVWRGGVATSIRRTFWGRPEDYPYGSDVFLGGNMEGGKGMVYGRQSLERFASRDNLKISRLRPSTPASHVAVEG